MYQKHQATQIFNGRELLNGAELVLITKQDGTVEAIVPLSEAGEDVQKLDGILSPGFVNAHCHLELSHMKGMIPEKTGLQEFVKQIVALRQVDPEAIQEAIVAAETEMMANGIVAVGDISNTLDTLNQKAKHNLAYYSFVELYDLDPTRAHDKIIAGIDIQKQFQENCIRASLVPHAPYSVTARLWTLLSEHFESHTISLHNQETPGENEFFENKTGPFLAMYERTKVALDFFEATGKTSLQSVLPVFKKAHHGILVHNSFTSSEDIQAVHAAMKNAFWCLCPNANQYIEETMPPIELLRNNHATMVVGTDSYASNWQLNILDELKTIQQHNAAIPLSEMLQWATINGARALQMDRHLGSFDKGKKPGVVLITGVDGFNGLKNASSKRIL
ncbi:MAG: amidohydrolase family protein [Sediminibacterium sp.]|nr:amidohydrolase family protein [Sediminibacterium sp.]